MRWFWTDELAAALTEHDHIPTEQVAEWITRPVAHAATDDTTALEIARRLFPGAQQDPAA